mmetsp:Transcript_30216/g.75717  ORF Transcript_30216/g.75717 Transcript_30216/m.75717 type:complete len:549 (-) Transcript_30216:197-1843(-)|eukprot:CAMPEP_0181352424 /NCGR_PEP_ID=MMETSP1106-20121128/2300_1 /TAXON_ID=81844 /ORGANISM="Mantoniella antarctica, Strain SL-175" /LENGTH=548 /DNA_ID=CAMNT_0023464979 /DNA_START=265 /DNA_END=1911 /DNA_ORIENTATION=+
MSSPAEHRRCYKAYGAETTHRSAQLPYHSDEFEWRSARALESKLEEAGVYELGITGGAKSSHQAVKLPTKSKGQGHQPSFMVSAIAQSKNEARNLKDILAKMEKRAVVAEERAAEAVVAERKARADAVAREKQLGSMRLRLGTMSDNIEVSEAHRKELQQYVGKLEKKLGGKSIRPYRVHAAERGGVFLSHGSCEPNQAERESLFEALSELQTENARLHSALQEVEEALDGEAKALSLADGGAILESLRTRRLLGISELTVKKEVAAKVQAETKLRQAETRANRAEDEHGDRIRAEDSLLARCEVAERDNQALLDYVQELTTQTVPYPAKRLSSQLEVNELKAMNEQLVMSTREAREQAARLSGQLEQNSLYEAENNGQVVALESIVDDLVSVLSKTLGLENISKGYQHASVDAMIFATQRLVTMLQTELRETDHSCELRETKEVLRSVKLELRGYKMKCERLATRTDELKEDMERRSPASKPSNTRVSPSVARTSRLSSDRTTNSKAVFASRIDRIAALKKRLGLEAALPMSSRHIGISDSSDEENQ